MQNKIREYLEWKGTYAPRASINYRIWLERFLTVCGEKKLEEYSITDFVRFHKWLEDRYSSYCVQFATIAIKNFFQFYRHQDYKCIQPSLIRIPQVKAKSHRAVTENEYERILSVIPESAFHTLRDSVMIRMLWDTGVRISELCDIPVSAINENKPITTISTKKTGRARTIVWSQATHVLLQKYLGIRQELQKSNWSQSLFVGFSKGHGWSLRLTSRQVQRRLKDYVKKAGIKEKITPHSFRHGWAHKRRDQNAPLAFIQRGLGHNHPISTFVYEQYNDREFEQFATKYLAG